MFPTTATAALLLAGSALAQTPATGPDLTLEQLRTARRELAHRPRRIIANNDGCDALYFPRDTEVTVANFLAERTTALAGSQVDTIAYCTISSGFSYFTHNTRVGTVLTRQPADYGLLPNTRNVTQDLIDLGSDALQSVVGFGREQRLEVFWSMRMNDTHDVEHRPEKPYMLFPPLKVEHPEWLVGDYVKRTPQGRWSSVDYARPEIRDLAFRYIEEICRNYDVDGVELDFFRHLCFFRSVANGGKASQEERDMMTDLLRRVRQMTEEVGLQRKRPVLVAVRVPDSVEFDRDMGLDIERWLAEDLVDLLITTCYFRLNPWEYSVELGHRYSVPVYPCLSDSRVTGESRFRRASIESYRGRAMNAWVAGADGIHLFNLFNPKSPVFREAGDPTVLAGLNKLYFATVRDGSADSWLAGGEAYRNVPLLTPSHPASIAPDSPLEIELPVGEDLEGARQAGRLPVVTLHLEMPAVTRPEQLRVTLNSQALAGGSVANGWVDLPVPLEHVKRGANRVRVELDPANLPPPTEWTLTYEATAKPAAPWFRDPGSERTEEKLADGALFIADRGTVSGDYHYYRYPWGAGPNEPLTIEARVKVVSGSSFIIFSNGVATERLGLWPDHLDLWTDNSIRYNMDTTDGFHVYRIETRGEHLRVYVDGELRIEAKGQFKARGARADNQLAFGTANSTMVGEAYWAGIRAHVAGQSCRDMVVSVTYP
ncbi:MAG: hypothetical protein FJX75_05140 [Armatimonadetes bacterium]|nr:hypothetical protein [Armatimonadota bacterium]